MESTSGPLDAASDLALANRLEVLRRERGLSLEDVALRSGVSRATLSRIERGETSPTANNLGRLCAAYGLTMSQLLAPIEEGGPRLIRHAEAQRWRDPETGFERTILSPPAQSYDIQVMLGELPPGADISYPLPAAASMEQHNIVLSGELTLTFDGRTYHLKPLDSLRVKLFGASRFQNTGKQLARYIVINRTQP